MPYADPAAKRAHARRWYYAHREQAIADRVAYNKIRNARWREFSDGLKSEPCTDCGQCFHPRCMDFHHRDPSSKLFKPSEMWRYGLTKVMAEIAKCDLLCANCHRLREAGITQ